MLGKRKGKQRREYVPDYVLYDLETTGISSLYDEVIEISAVKVRNGKIVDEFSELVNPGRPIPYAASSVNNISDKMVENARSFEKVLPEFLAFAGDDVLAGHNIAGFDMKFLYRDCEKYFGQTLTNDYIDTLAIAKLCFPEWKHRRLSDLAEHYGMSPNYFSSMFKKEMSRSAVNYITELRINQARELLYHSELSVVDISKKVGYEDSQYFFRVFKKYLGMTPLQYREESRK